MKDAVQKLRQRRAAKIDEARAILETAEAEERALTEDEQSQWDGLIAAADGIKDQIERQERQAALDAELETRTPVRSAESGEEAAEGVEVKLGEEERAEHRALYTLRLMQGNALRNRDIQQEAAEKLIKGGHYGEDAARNLNGGMRADKAIVNGLRDASERKAKALYGDEFRAAGDYYSTLVNADGAYLLPTVVVQEIEEIAEQVGVMLQLSQPYNHIVGNLRVPGASGADSAMSFVAEGAEITSRMRAFQAVELNPKKVADIIPWTYEINVEAGPRILRDVQRVMGRAYGKAVDDAAINGDASSSYNSISGVLDRSGTGEVTLAVASTFDDISPDNLILGINEVPAGVRSNFAYVFHPDMKAVFKTKKDTNGSYLFNWNEDPSTGIMRVAGIPVYFTEVLPALSDTAASTSFGIGGNFDYLKIALGGGIQTEEASTGTVKDADTGASINLFTQDLRALKYRAFFDIDANFNSAFMKFTTGAAS